MSRAETQPPRRQPAPQHAAHDRLTPSPPAGGQPRVYREVLDYWSAHKPQLLADYTCARCSFLAWCLPQEALALSAGEVLAILRERFGADVDKAVTGVVPSPVARQADGNWLTRSNVIGINVRTLGSFWKVLPYLLTVPASWDAVHLLPIWEPGVIGSLYGVSSWEINGEFFSAELAAELTDLNTVERQLRFVTNMIHLMGRPVGLDVIPHTDRFSQITLAQPWCFEWLQREDLTLIDHGDHLIPRVEQVIYEWLRVRGPAVQTSVPESPGTLFYELSKTERTLLLFGPADDKALRDERRGELVGQLYGYGYEPVPATMAPPFRGLSIDPDTRYTDADGRVWRDYRITEPQAMSRVFGPLTRYRLYRGRGDSSWALDFSQPVPEVWDYIAECYAETCAAYGFDFMRGDMSHVQMRPGGVPAAIDDYYDILGFVKRRVCERCKAPFFAYFAESFLAARDVFGYGEEIDHLEASQADAVLGDLQSEATGTPEFMRRVRWYLDLARTRGCTPSFTIITGDKDDPRFDEFYRAGNAARYFAALFLTDIPSYVALGFETRDVRMQPAPNEYYTKLYVFQEQGESNTYPSKAVHGPYRWNTNGAQFAALTRIRVFAESILPEIRGRRTRLLIAPDAEHGSPVMAWTQDAARPEYLFIVNFGTDRDSGSFGVPVVSGEHSRERGSERPASALELLFSTELGAGAPDAGESAVKPAVEPRSERIGHNGYHYRLENLRPGVAQVYRYCY